MEILCVYNVINQVLYHAYLGNRMNISIICSGKCIKLDFIYGKK